MSVFETAVNTSTTQHEGKIHHCNRIDQMEETASDRVLFYQ